MSGSMGKILVLLIAGIVVSSIVVSFVETVKADKEVIFPDENLEKVIREELEKDTGPIYVSDLETLGGLDASNRNITSIEGLEYCKNITWLYLFNNNISDISPLSNLTNITELYLDNNNISDISPLVKNSGINEGDILSITNNPLSAESINTYIPELVRRGVEVTWEPVVETSTPPPATTPSATVAPTTSVPSPTASTSPSTPSTSTTSSGSGILYPAIAAVVVIIIGVAVYQMRKK
ncbi:MAG: leucine-rich repeat domain-containing protein [Methanomicrobia archaeon]|nr:leucine-rich repeat domain-containing protein [Methanomicrobia archaeon]